MISKIISGGQTGVDIAALRAGMSRGIPTGGTMPKGFRTLAGPKPEWAAEFGLVEHASPAYPPRTYDNVRNADITIRIAVDFDSAGERCTQMAIDKYKRPQFDVYVIDMGTSIAALSSGGRYRASKEHTLGAANKIREVSDAIGRDVVVNFAGNSEKTARGIDRFAENVVRLIIEATCG